MFQWLCSSHRVSSIGVPILLSSVAGLAAYDACMGAPKDLNVVQGAVVVSIVPTRVRHSVEHTHAASSAPAALGRSS